MNSQSPADSQPDRPHRASLRSMLQRRWASLDRAQRGLLMLTLARLLLALLFLLNVLPLELRYRWYLHHGGDQDLMLSLARSIVAGVPEQSVVGIGQALVMVPWVALLRPENIIHVALPLEIINGFLLAGISVLLVGGIARTLTGSMELALWAAGVWAFLPLIAYLGFFWHEESVILRSTLVPRMGWLDSLSDGPATFYLLLAIFLLAKAPRDGDSRLFWWMAGVGTALSLAFMFRVHVATMLAFLLVYVWVVHGWHALLTVCGAGLLTYVPQAWYNLAVFGLPITVGYISYGDVGAWGGTLRRALSDILNNLPFHPRYLVEIFQYSIGEHPWLLVPLALMVAVGIATAVLLGRQRGWWAVALLIGAPLAYLGPMLAAFNFRNDVPRFMMPVIPMGIIAGVYLVGQMWRMLRGLRDRQPAM